ncbi:MAG: hypothetical protein IJR27_02575 [Synergistaceae bacterium]|nr:hypothetical protein [Synergistaceae bacterium]
MQAVMTKPFRKVKREVDYIAIEALRELGRMSELQGKDKITLEEIEEEIAAVRAGR